VTCTLRTGAGADDRSGHGPQRRHRLAGPRPADEGTSDRTAAPTRSRSVTWCVRSASRLVIGGGTAAYLVSTWVSVRLTTTGNLDYRNTHRSVRASPSVLKRTSHRSRLGSDIPCIRRAQAGSSSSAACVVIMRRGSSMMLGAGSVRTRCATWRVRLSQSSSGFIRSITSSASARDRGIGLAPNAEAICATSVK
jgi:hypothetical protein